MKKITLTFLLFSICFLNAQEKWQNHLFNNNNNFFDIQNDFNKYYDSVVKTENKIPKGLGIKQFKRWEYYWESRVDTDGNFPKNGHLLDEMTKYLNSKNISQNTFRNYQTGIGNWEIVGPIELPDNGTGQLNGNGRLNCISFHPTDANTIFVGAPSGGVWKTTDGGATWTEYSNGLIRLGVSSIAIDPNTPSTLYIGTGDRDANTSPGYGVWRSIDGGLNWTAHNNGMGNRTINEIIMDPNNANIMLAAASNGYVYRTTDGGSNWTQSSQLYMNPKDIAFHPTNSNIVYAGGTKFYKSTDGGLAWTEVTSGLPSGAQRIALAVSQNQPDWVYLLVGNGLGLMGIYRSTDSGSNFSTRTTSPNILGYQINGSDNNSQAWYDLVIAADPTDANTIYTGGINIWKSTDGGTTMNCASYWVGSNGGIDGVHADQHALEFSPHTNALYSGNDGGIYISTNNGNDWDDLSSGLAIAQVYKIGVSQTEAELVINGFQDNGTAIARDNNFSTSIGGDGMECIIDPTNENYMYGALYYGEINRSTNGGSSFGTIANNGTNGINESGAWVTPYKLDPNNNSRMLIGYSNLWRSNDVVTPASNSINWTQISNFTGTSKIRDIAIAPSNSNVVYISSDDNTFRRSTNATSGAPTWTDLSGSLPVNSWPKDIEIDPTDPTHVFIAMGNNIYGSTDSGTNWTNISGTLPNISLNTIIIDKESTVDAMYVGMDLGVYYKDNNMSDWELYSNGLANVEITELEIQYASSNCSSKLYAATYGQGLWKSDLKDPGNITPTACFKANIINPCIDDIIVLNDLSDFSPTSWSWSITPSTFNFVNGTNSNSQNPEIEFTDATSYTIELTATNSTGADTATKNSYISVTSSDLASNFNLDFQNETVCSTSTDCGATVCNLSGKWINLVNGTNDDIDWRVDNGGTPSNNTGPDVDYNIGTAAGNYIYLEASSCFNQTAILESGCVNLDQGYNFEFAYHMFGNTMGSLHIDIIVSGNLIENIITPISGNQGDSWKTSSIDLSAYTGQSIRFRIRGVIGNGFESDIAIDDIKFSPIETLSNEELTISDISIHPNPFSDTITISNPNFKDLNTLEVYDLSGRLINKFNLKDMKNSLQIDLSNLESSIYLMVIKSNQGSITKKLIKK